MARSKQDRDDNLRGLERGLAVLEFLNVHDNASVAEVVRGVDLPRTTVFRILAALERLEFVARSGERGRYRLAIRVRELADGYDDESWVADIARPRVQALGDELLYPVLLATPSGSKMLWRVATDRTSALAVRRYHIGLRTVLTESATGLVYLASCTAPQRAAVLDLVATLREYHARRAFDRKRIEAEVAQVQKQGFSIFTRTLARETAFAVPVLAHSGYLASLAVRYPRGAFSEAEARKRFFAPMRTTAAEIGQAFATGNRPGDRTGNG